MSSDSQDSEGEDLGTIRPTLIKELRNILDLYPDDGQILKELIQNAEDAGATVVKMLTDKRHFNQHVDTRTLRNHPHLKFFKGPALCVYNNAQFTEADWKGIRMLHTSIKEDDPLKVGRFGLGFKSVFHLTDRLVILSGDYIMYMDPFKGEDHYCNWRRVAGRKGRELQSVLQSMAGVFGICEGIFDAKFGHFPGTVFWFPLRQNVSDLSSTVYTDQSVENLLSSFRTEAPSLLLFLNRVQCVQILSRDDTYDPKELFSVGIAPSCLEAVQAERDRFLKDITSVGADLPVNETFCVTEVVMETKDYISSLSKSQKWLVVNYHCGKRQVSDALLGLCCNPELSYRPYVGVAIPLTDQDTFQSQVFCFLPLPLDTRSPTGLPLHVHGYFALEQNRRHLKWPTADQLYTRVAFDPASQWNCLLVTELIPRVYQKALFRLLELSGDEQETFYRAWPDVSRVHDRWKPLLKPLYTYLSQHPVFISHNQGKQWVTLQRAVLQYFSPQVAPEVKNSVMKVYTNNRYILVELWEHVFNTLNKFHLLKGICDINASHVSQLIHKCLPLLTRSDKLNLLHYLCSDNTHLLLDQNLLPLADKVSFGFFRSAQNRQSSTTFLCPDHLVRLFPGLEAEFCDNNIPAAIRDDLQRLAVSGTLSVQVLHENDPRIPGLLQKSLQARFGARTPVLHATDPWVQQVWHFLASVQSLSAYTHIPLLPMKTQGNYVSLLSLVGRYVCSSAGGMPPLPSALGDALTKLGITVLCELPDYITRHREMLGSFINYPSTQGVLRAVRGVNDNLSLRNSAVRTFNTEATEGEKEALIQFLCNAGDFCGYLPSPSLFHQLNLFKVALKNQMVSLDEVNQIGPSDLPPVLPPVHLLDCNSSERRAALILGATEMSLKEVVQTIMKTMCSTSSPYSTHEVVQFMIYFLQTETLVSDATLQKMSRNIRFVMTKSGALMMAENVYDPSSPLLQELFNSQSESLFPCGKFAEPEILQKLKKIGLRSERNVSSDDLIKVAHAISDMWSKNEQLSAKKDAEGLFKYLNKYHDYVISATFNTISTIQCLPCLQTQERPAFYPNSLPVKSTPSLVRPADMYPKHLLSLTGSVAPIARCDLGERFADQCLLQHAKPQHVLQHLRKVTMHFQQQEVTQYKLILNDIFNYLQEYRNNAKFTAYLQKERCVLIESGEYFVHPDRFWIQRQASDIDLKPYRFPLPIEMQQMKALMVMCGSLESQTDHMLHKVLSEIQHKHTSKDVSDQDFTADLQLVKQILDVLRKSRTAHDGRTLLPVVHDQTSVLSLKPASECTVMPGMVQSNTPLDVGFEVYFVHPDIPHSTALGLGASQMEDRFLDGVEDLDYGYEQREDLTSRLHGLLQESYTDGFSVPKELIQNADDACASKVCFILDERENNHSRTNLITNTMASLQGPAIWAYNDAMFSKSDFENIIKLGAGTKKENTSKIGRFGLGFNAVYNLTDVPCFLSGHIMAMFDPQVRYLRKGAGLKLDFTKPVNQALLSTKPEQFQPFQNVFGCSLKSSGDICYKGTLFRFPLRTIEQAIDNKLKSDSYSVSKRHEFLKMLLEKAGSLLLFTQNVKEIEVFYIPSECSDPNDKKCMLTVKKTCLNVVSQSQVQLNNKTVLQFMKECWSEKNSDIKIQQKLQIDVEVTAEACGVCGVDKSNNSTQWQVAWASGIGESARMTPLMMDKGLVPLAAAAISISDCGLVSLVDNPTGFYNTGHLFCFLPLPEDLEVSRVSLPVHVNGTFALTSDRRGLMVQTEDDLDSGGSSWNTALYSDAVCRAYLLLLQQVRKEADMDVDFCRYFDLWPKTSVSCLVKSFYCHLQSGAYKVLPVPDQKKWVSFTDAWFLQPQFRDSDCGKVAWKVLQRFWKGPGYLVDIPSAICKLMKDKGPPGIFTAKLITQLAFYRDFFFPNIASDWWNPEERNFLTHHAVMQGNKEIDQLLQDSACCPCQGGKLLRKPNEMVSPNRIVAKLFLISDQRFPLNKTKESGHSADNTLALNRVDFCNESTLERLSGFGMMTDSLPWDMVLERARSVEHLKAENRVEECLSRAFSLIEYLSVHVDTDSQSDLRNCPGNMKHLLSQTAFLPVLGKPLDWPFPWAGGEDVDSHPLAAPADLCLDDLKHLVACKRKLINSRTLSGREVLLNGKKRKVLRELGTFTREDVSNSKLIEGALEQLFIVAKQHNQNAHHSELSQSISNKVYTYLNNCLEKGKWSKVVNRLCSQLTDKSIVWTGSMFVQPSSVAFECQYDCTPFLFKLGNSLQMFELFFEAVGVKKTFNCNDMLSVLQKVNRENSGQLSDNIVALVSRVAQLLGDVARQTKQDGQLDTSRVFLPDIDGFMHQAASLCVDDCGWLTRTDGMKFVNEKISKETARCLGAKTKKRQHFSLLATPIKAKPFGQFEKLTTRIKRLLQGYTFDSSLCKELMQNADDAEATEAMFIMDFRHLPTDTVPENFESLQGPALSFYNNKSFTAADMEGIQNLGVGSKGQDDQKIGQYGVGFNAVFHITDIPSFWTKVDDKDDAICILDPNCQFIPDIEPSIPGIEITDLDEVKQKYPDFFAGYLPNVIDTTQSGTLFRFPLRTIEMADQSDIKTVAVTETEIKKLLDKFRDEISTCLLFLNNLQTVGIYLVCADGSLEQEFVVKKTCDDISSQKLKEFNVSLQQASLMMKQDSVTVTDIPVYQSVVQSKIADSRGNSEDWLIVHRVGFPESVGFSPELLHDWGKENFRLLPCGGVAVKLRSERSKDSNATASPEGYQAFCTLPLPVFTGLPMHLNGHFILDHETRRNLWNSGNDEDDVRSEWNDAIAFWVIVPAYITALEQVKHVMFPDNGKGFSGKLMTSALKKYHDMFPQPVSDKFWVKVVYEIYKGISEKELSLFPVLCAGQILIEWIPAVRKNGFPGYFSNLVSIFTEKIKKGQSERQVVLTGGISSASVNRTTNEPNRNETATEFQELLKGINMKILETPMRVYENFKASGVNGVQELTAHTVLGFLRSSGQNVRGGCKLGNLPKPVAETPLKTAFNVRKLVEFVSEDADFHSLDGLPLCLRQSETLHAFTKTNLTSTPIISRYCHLLPGSAEDFLHECLVCFLEDLKLTNGVMQTLSISMFASRLHMTLTDPSFSSSKPCVLQLTRFPSVPSDKHWLADFCAFLEEQITEQCKQMKKQALCEQMKQNEWDVKEVRLTAEKELSCLKKWCLIPVKKKDGNQEKHMLYPLQDMHLVVYMSFSQDQANPRLCEVLKRLPLPFLDNSLLSGKMMKSLVASINHPRALLRAVASCGNSLSAKHEDGYIILDYFSKTLEILRDSCNDERQLREELRSLPIFPSVVEGLVSVAGSILVLCLNSSIPKDGLREWSHNSLHLLRTDYIPKELQEFLEFRFVANTDFYSKYLLPSLEVLPREAILCHMTFLRDKFKWDASCDPDLCQVLKSTAFIDIQGSLNRADAFFSPHESVFRTMCPRQQFPPEPYNKLEWKDFMIAGGMVSQVTSAMFLKFAHAVEKQGGRDENVDKKSRILVEHLFRRKDLADSQLLSEVRNIRFVLPSLWILTDHGQKLIKIVQPFCPTRLISFFESVFEEHLHLVWSSSCVLHPSADPRTHIHSAAVLNQLGLDNKAPKEKVIQHVRNMCQILSGQSGPDIFQSLLHSNRLLVSVMEDIYRYLEDNLDIPDIPSLAEVPLICDIDNRQMLKPANVVIDLRQNEMIKGHVEKAPQVFGRFFEFFKKLGAAQCASANHYAQFLTLLKTESGDVSLHVEELKLVKTALENLFHCLKEESATQKTIEETSLYLPTEEKTLQKSTAIVYKDGGFGKRFRTQPGNMYFFLGFKKLEIEFSTPLEEVKLLPREHQMVMLSQIVKEIIPDTLRENAVDGVHSRDLIARLENPNTKAAIVRLAYHHCRMSETSFTFESAQDVLSKLSCIWVKEIADLRTVLTLYDQSVPESDSRKSSFVDKSKGEQREAIIYVDPENLQNMSAVNPWLHTLAVAVNFVLEKDLEEILLYQILHNPAEAKNILDNANIDECNYHMFVEGSVFPAPGTFLPLDQHCYLDNTFYNFEKNEYVGYEVYDPDIENEEGHHDAVYIYAVVMEEVYPAGEPNVPEMARCYRISLGPARGEAVVSVTRLYKFFRKHTQTSSENTGPTEDIEVHMEQTHTEKKDIPLNMQAVLKDNRRILTETWQQLTQDSDRRRVIKRLLLKWHPDRNHGNEQFCTCVTQKILHYVDLLYEGRTLPTDADHEENGDISSCRTDSTFNSSFYAKMNERARRYRTSYESQSSFNMDSSFHGSFHEETRHRSNPQPGESYRWFRQAEADVAAAKSARGTCDRGCNWICYQCHQAVEKAIQAVIYCRNADILDMQSHDLPRLAAITDDSIIIDLAGKLERRVGPHTRMRYPDVLAYPQVPADVYNDDDVSWVCEVATRVLEHVRSLIQEDKFKNTWMCSSSEQNHMLG